MKRLFDDGIILMIHGVMPVNNSDLGGIVCNELTQEKVLLRKLS